MAKEYGRGTKIIWSDTKRWCGLPITFTHYDIVEKKDAWVKLVSKSGMLSTRLDEVMVYRIDDLQINQTLFDKMWGVGTITVFCNDASSSKVMLYKIANPRKVYNLLSELIQQERKRVKMGHGEFMS